MICRLLQGFTMRPGSKPGNGHRAPISSSLKSKTDSYAHSAPGATVVQFSTGFFSAWSITSMSTGALCLSSFRPSAFSNDAEAGASGSQINWKS